MTNKLCELNHMILMSTQLSIRIDQVLMHDYEMCSNRTFWLAELLFCQTVYDYVFCMISCFTVQIHTKPRGLHFTTETNTFSGGHCKV